MSDSESGEDVAVNVSKLGSGLEKADDTTQLNERRIATDIGRGIQPPYDPDRLAAFMELNETHGASIQKKARYEVGHGFDVVPHRGVDAEEASDEQYEAVTDFWFGTDSTWQSGPNGTAATTPEEVLELARIDYHAIGWCAVEILTANDGTPTGLAHLPARTVRVRKAETDGDEVIRGHGYVQVREGRTRYFGEAGDRYGEDPKFVDKENGDVADDARALSNEPANEAIFIMNPSPLALYYGVPDWISATRTIAADEAAKDYNHDFFEHNAVPYYAVKVTGGTLTEDSKQDLREMLNNLRGSPHRTVVLEVEQFGNGLDEDVDIELVPLSASRSEDMEFENFRERNEHEIAKVHEVPPVLLNRTETSNRSNSKEQVQEFALSVVAPEQQKFASRLYQVLHQDAFDAPDWTVEFELRGAEQPKEDADIARRRTAGSQGTFTVDEARDEFGKDPLPEDHPVDGNTLLADLNGQAGGDDFRGRPEDAPPVENQVGTRTGLGLTKDELDSEQVEAETFDSSNIHSALYDSTSNDLYVRFHGHEDESDRIYVYLGVTEDEWESWLQADSKGSYHYENIRMSYPYEELTSTTDWPQVGS